MNDVSAHRVHDPIYLTRVVEAIVATLGMLPDPWPNDTEMSDFVRRLIIELEQPYE